MAHWFQHLSSCTTSCVNGLSIFISRCLPLITSSSCLTNDIMYNFWYWNSTSQPILNDAGQDSHSTMQKMWDIPIVNPECGWVKLNVLAPSIWEMGPGRRQDTIDCNISDENWKKFCGIGKRPIFQSMMLCTTDNSAPQVKLCDTKSLQQLKTWQNIQFPIRNLNQPYL